MKELNDVLPILQEAEAALDTLNTQDIAVIKGVNSPASGVLATIKAIYMLMMKQSNPKKIDWKECRQMMSGQFLDKLKNFNRNDIPEKVVQNLEKFKQETPEFALDKVKS
mmetsp:Transcript_44059/g.42672  ORF Transcript_44059/g.42672 Transcript_44059/m.42672 type:complete len:110 (-) Transcript_44059:452-781(-)